MIFPSPGLENYLHHHSSAEKDSGAGAGFPASYNICAEKKVELTDFSLDTVLIEILNKSSISERVRAANVIFTCNFRQEVTLKSDPAILKELLICLIDNAIKFLKPEDMNPVVSISVNKALAETKITVSDKGIGISKALQPRISDLFLKGASINKNNGFGLVTAKTCAEKLGGELRVQSEEGIGTAVSVLLPA